MIKPRPKGIDGLAQSLLARGGNGFIQKPFDAASLSAKLHELT